MVELGCQFRILVSAKIRFNAFSWGAGLAVWSMDEDGGSSGPTARMNNVGSNAEPGKMLLEVKREQDVGRFGLGVCDNAVVSIRAALAKRSWERLEVVFLGRHQLALEVVVGKADGRQSVSGAAERYDAGRTGRVGLGRLAQKRQQEVGEEKGADVVGAELLLDALGRRVARSDDDAGVVDEDVEPVGQASHPSRSLAYRLL